MQNALSSFANLPTALGSLFELLPVVSIEKCPHFSAPVSPARAQPARPPTPPARLSPPARHPPALAASPTTLRHASPSQYIDGIDAGMNETFALVRLRLCCLQVVGNAEADEFRRSVLRELSRFAALQNLEYFTGEKEQTAFSAAIYSLLGAF